jgi:hypothetical protein
LKYFFFFQKTKPKRKTGRKYTIMGKGFLNEVWEVL